VAFNNRKLDKESGFITTDKLPLWIVRAGPNGEQENDAIEKNIVTIAWNQLPDLSQIEDKQSLKQLYFTSNPNAKEMSVSNTVGSIWRFVNEIKQADFGLLQCTTTRPIL
jgi:restriction system protein